MSEEIYKAKKTGSGEWTEGFYIKSGNTGYIVPCITNESSFGLNDTVQIKADAYKVDPETLCRYTGKKDVNGVKIWENDIIYANTSSGIHAGIVLYGSDDQLHYGYYLHWLTKSYYRTEFLFWVPKIEVKGSLIDNTEILKISES